VEDLRGLAVALATAGYLKGYLEILTTYLVDLVKE
jgi:hypothetical protein